ncbi:Unknown protein [Striga hermonthica]|uniref:Transmembrane protein n=1 Tax=Striga hermonthica TaxID=68872 RepID=A0A9N7RBP1_STRHE|nr:Unknown protein [Striga hermonthica]
MSDWGPVFVAVVLFFLLTPGLLIQFFFLLAWSIKLLCAPAMADWGPVLIGVVLFVLLQPGLVFQFPGNNRQVEFGSMKTNGKAITVHTLIFFALYAVFILAVHVHIYTG